MRYERDAWASHFVCIAFSLSFFPFLPPVPLHSWKRSNAVRRQTLPRLHCRFCQRAKQKFAPRAQIRTSARPGCWPSFCSLRQAGGDGGRVRCSGAKKGEAHTVFRGNHAARFSFHVRLGSSAPRPPWFTNWHFLRLESAFRCFYSGLNMKMSHSHHQFTQMFTNTLRSITL